MDIQMQIATDKAKEEWNALADEYNQWEELDSDEKLGLIYVKIGENYEQNNG